MSESGENYGGHGETGRTYQILEGALGNSRKENFGFDNPASKQGESLVMFALLGDKIAFPESRLLYP